MRAPRETRIVSRRYTSTGLSIDTVVAGVIAVLLAVPSPISVSLSLGGAISLALGPVTFPALWSNARGRLLFIATLSLLPMGWLVAQPSLLQDNGRTFSFPIFLFQTAMPVGLIASAVGTYWCMTKLGLERFLLLSCAGLLAATLFDYPSQNPWKFGLALPISILAFLLIARNRLLLGLVVTPLLCAVSLIANFRSWPVILGLATVLVVFARSHRKPPSAWRLASYGLAAVTSGAVIAGLVVQASTAGLLGDDLEQRTKRQLEASGGNLLLGGRPEWGAGYSLWRENPLGLGIGVSPSSDDFWYTIRNLPGTGQAAQEASDVAQMLKQGLVGFHSTIWSFGCIYGVAGVLFSILALVFFAQATLVTATSSGRPNVRAAVLLLMFSSSWDILFSPTSTTLLGIALATALHVTGDPKRLTDTKEGIPT
jgi:hypothetical protein